MTKYLPAVGNTIPDGFCNADVFGDAPPPKVHDQEVGLPVLLSVKVTEPPAQIEVALTVKLATGGLGLICVNEP